MNKSYFNPFIFSIFVICFCFLGHNFSAFAQEEEEEVHRSLRYLRDKYEEFYDADFNIVWLAVKNYVDATACRILSEKERENDEKW